MKTIAIEEIEISYINDVMRELQGVADMYKSRGGVDDRVNQVVSERLKVCSDSIKQLEKDMRGESSPNNQ